MRFHDKIIMAVSRTGKAGRPWRSAGSKIRSRKIRIRDKIITAACRTLDGIEWTSLKIRPDGTEPIGQNAMPIIHSEESTTEETLASFQLPPEFADNLKGDVTVSLRTSELLLRTLEFPTSDPQEIADMAVFQLDKLSPFSSDQMAISHEVLQHSEDQSLVLMAAAKRERIDSISETFGRIGIRIHSIDARVLGWLHLLRDGGHISDEGCEIFVIDDGIDCVLAILVGGQPMAFRSLHASLGNAESADELAYEASYTLATLNAEFDFPPLAAIQLWSHNEIPEALCDQLAEQSGIALCTGNLSELPPLSEGIVKRTLGVESRIELIPREWIDHEKHKQLLRKFYTYCGSMAAIWLLIMLVLTSIYRVRNHRLQEIQKRADAIAPTARQALEDRQKLKALKQYTDRSDSSLECLREIVRLMPEGDIEFTSYNYTKGKGVSLRGTSANDNIAYDFFGTVATSPLFKDIKDQSVNTRVKRNVRRSNFAATLELPSPEEAK